MAQRGLVVERALQQDAGLSQEGGTLVVTLALLLRGPAVADVAGDVRVAAQSAVAIAKLADAHVSHEARAVAAGAPVLLLVPAVLVRHVQHLLPPALVAAFVTVQDAEGLSDHVLGLIAVDPGGAAVPLQDRALGVEHEDRVVLHAVGHQASFALGALGTLVQGGQTHGQDRRYRHHQHTAEVIGAPEYLVRQSHEERQQHGEDAHAACRASRRTQAGDQGRHAEEADQRDTQGQVQQRDGARQCHSNSRPGAGPTP